MQELFLQGKNGRMEEWNNACPVHPVGFIDLSYGVKCDAGAISTGEGWNKEI